VCGGGKGGRGAANDFCFTSNEPSHLKKINMSPLTRCFSGLSIMVVIPFFPVSACLYSSNGGEMRVKISFNLLPCRLPCFTVYLYLYIYLSIYLSIQLSTYLSTHLLYKVHTTIFIFLRLFIQEICYSSKDRDVLSLCVQ
jgi:hypothetical protein